MQRCSVGKGIRSNQSALAHLVIIETMHSITNMFSLKLAITTFFALFTVGQSQQFFIQNWGNGEPTTNYTYTSLEAGRYKVDWRLGAGGNFVAGKGYRGSQNLSVPRRTPLHPITPS